MEKEILLYEDIVPKSLNKVIDALYEADGSDVKIRINCLGGDVDTGFLIYNELRRYAAKYGAKVTTLAEGECASIATVIFLAGDKRIINSTQRPFVHAAWISDVSGNSKQLVEAAMIAEEATERIAKHYAEHTNMSYEQAIDFMRKDSFLSPEQCISLRFAHEVETLSKPINKLNKTINKSNLNTMNKKKIGLMAKVANLVLRLRTNALLVKTADQDTLNFYDVEDGVEPQVGDMATVQTEDGQELDPHNYYLESEGKIEIGDGKIYVFGDADEPRKLTQILADREELEKQDDEEAAVLQAAYDTIVTLKARLDKFEKSTNNFKGSPNKPATRAKKQSSGYNFESIAERIKNRRK